MSLALLAVRVSIALPRLLEVVNAPVCPKIKFICNVCGARISGRARIPIWGKFGPTIRALKAFSIGKMGLGFPTQRLEKKSEVKCKEKV
jgi:hypothetical protein